MNNLYNKLITASPTQEPTVAQQMQKFLVQQAWYLPVAATPLADFYSPSITGVSATGSRDTAYIVEFAPASKKK